MLETAEQPNVAETKTKPEVPDFVKNGLKELAGHFGELFESKQESQFLFGKMIQDKEVRVALSALARSLLNIGISIVDVVPGIGDVISVGADVAKLTEFDLTPDVGKGIAWGSEILEFFTGGAMPSHAIETTIQMVKDVPRIVKGLKKAEKIWNAHNQVDKSEKVQSAASIFSPAPVAA
jgi:hypothetical protein